MMLRKAAPILAAAIAVAAALIAACGDEDAAENGAAPTATVTASPAPEPRTPPPDARTAVLLEDASAFLARFSEDVLAARECSYEATHALVDCTAADRGFIVLEPPLPLGEGISCRLLLHAQEPVGVSCSGQEPLFAAVYELEQE